VSSTSSSSSSNSSSSSQSSSSSLPEAYVYELCSDLGQSSSFSSASSESSKVCLTTEEEDLGPITDSDEEGTPVTNINPIYGDCE
jgi:hypothetical protein